MADQRSVHTLWVVSAQMLNSAANLLLQVLLAASLSAAGFGTAVVALSIYYFALAMVRAAVGDVVSAFGPLAGRYCIRTTAAVAAMGSAALGVGAVMTAQESGFFLALASALPILLFHDLVRYVLWARRDALLVAGMDFVRLAAVLPGIAAAAFGGSSTVILAWWIVGGVGGLVLAFVRRPRVLALDRDGGRLARRAASGFIGDQLPNALVAHLLPILLAVSMGPALAGTYRVALLPFMLAETVLLAVRVTVLSGSGVEKSGSRWLAARHSARLYAGVSIISMLPVLLLAFEPIRSVLGEAGEAVGGAFVVAAALIVTRAVGRPFSDAVAIESGYRRTAPARLGGALVELVAACMAGVWWGLFGVLVARLLTALGMALVWSLLLRRSGGVNQQTIAAQTGERADEVSPSTLPDEV